MKERAKVSRTKIIAISLLVLVAGINLAAILYENATLKEQIKDLEPFVVTFVAVDSKTGEPLSASVGDNQEGRQKENQQP